jgi:hypothetical protein
MLLAVSDVGAVSSPAIPSIENIILMKKRITNV